MHDRWTWVVVAVCLAALMLACHGRAVVRGEQYAYRDAAHYYYPLHQRVQAEWDAGRWPLWEPEENGGMPLLGNPTAAVLYPGKLIFALTPYPLGARLYVIGHVLLAFAAMLILMRSWGASAAAAGLSAGAYAFGGPILFQYCNIIYLVGAAWAPLGVRAADRWLRLGRRVAVLELAAVLALEVLGGDPETAYLTGLCAGGYALALAGSRRSHDNAVNPARTWLLGLGLLLGLAGWSLGTLALARVAPLLRTYRPSPQPPAALHWMPWASAAVAAVWGLVGFRLLSAWNRGRRDPKRSTLVPMLAGLAASAALAGALAGAQLLPVLEFTGQSVRAAGEGPHDVYPFSLRPSRVVEFLWPNVFGTPFHGNRSWESAVPPAGKNAKIWIPTLYVGGLTIALALGALTIRFRGAAPWRAWLTMIAVVSLFASFGEYGGPLWWARLHPKVAARIGPQDAQNVATIRADGSLRDGDGGVYWFLATALPGFRQFRFPSKLLTFTALGIAALAGTGLDGILRGDRHSRRATAAWSAALLAVSLATWIIAWTQRDRFGDVLRRLPSGSSFGPLDVPGAINETLRGLAQGSGVLALALCLALWGRQRPRLAAALALVLSTADVANANARYVLTLPQQNFEKAPEVLTAIQAAEAADPSSGPYRVHRLPAWDLVDWQQKSSDDRVRDFVVWERDTLQPKYGINLGIQYTMTLGVAELYDYEWYFGGFWRTVQGEVAAKLGVPTGSKVIAYSRRAFDMWNTRYFVVPYFPNHWNDESRGFATFLQDVKQVYPPGDSFLGPGGPTREVDWARTHDVQVFRNKTTYPRSWVVHEQRYFKPIRALNRTDRNLPMQEILFSNDYLWHDAGTIVYDPKKTVWVEDEDRLALSPYATGGETARTETVTITRYESDRVELDATLERPGVVVLADVYYPGWTLTIDGRPAPVHRANRMMRGAAVQAGRHKIIYTYHPRSFRVGLVLSCVGLAALAALGAACAIRPRAGWGTDAPPTGGPAGEELS